MSGRPLWTPDNPPDTPHQLPNYMRPKTTGFLTRSSKVQLGTSKFLQEHYRKNKEDFPHIHSTYEMPAEQRRAAAKRNRLRKEREREEKLAAEEEEKTQVQTAHEVWVAWYETRYAQEKQEKAEIRSKSREEREKKLERETMRENALVADGLDYASWCKNKEKKELAERKKKVKEEKEKSESTDEIIEK